MIKPKAKPKHKTKNGAITLDCALDVLAGRGSTMLGFDHSFYIWSALRAQKNQQTAWDKIVEAIQSNPQNDPKNKKFSLQYSQKMWTAALVVAAKSNSVEVVDVVLKKGADPNDASYSTTALEHAYANNACDAFKLLDPLTKISATSIKSLIQSCVMQSFGIETEDQDSAVTSGVMMDLLLDRVTRSKHKWWRALNANRISSISDLSAHAGPLVDKFFEAATEQAEIYGEEDTVRAIRTALWVKVAFDEIYDAYLDGQSRVWLEKNARNIDALSAAKSLTKSLKGYDKDKNVFFLIDALCDVVSGDQDEAAKMLSTLSGVSWFGEAKGLKALREHKALSQTVQENFKHAVSKPLTRKM